KCEASNMKPQTLKLIAQACISGTNEVIIPMLSSVLVNCAVFLPLIFLSGISGALFYDQAVAIAIGAVSSWAVSITIIPVYYYLIFKKGKGFGENNWLKRINGIDYEAVYEKGFRFFIRKQWTVLAMIIIFLFVTVGLFYDLPKSKLPAIEKDELIMSVDWNMPVTIQENRQRVEGFLNEVAPLVIQSTALIGEQQFLLDKDYTATGNESNIYLKSVSSKSVDSIISLANNYFKQRYPEANISYGDADNIFNVIFSDNEPALEARLKATGDYGPYYNKYLKAVNGKINAQLGGNSVPPISWQEHVVLTASPERLLLYGVSYQVLYGKLKSMFNENQIFTITDNNSFVPVVLGGNPQTLRKIIDESYIQNSSGENIPVRELLDQSVGSDLKSIVAGKEGEYYPLALADSKPKESMQLVKTAVRDDGHFEVSFAGRYFSNKKMVKELFVILLISLALLYFILASQFESLVLPLIILVEVPLDFFGVFLFLKLGGSGINLMSMIGIVVMAGIVVNDSILKIDTVNQLRKEGYGLLRALLVAGQRRLKPILMTALVTIIGIAPVLFAGGLGADLQRPLALANIGGMIVGTFVSLYIIPLLYFYLNRKIKVKDDENKK
ncbi:MAG TPA: efflux RND transporter permease subunit, partial [Prolixibacteraceae bacterium]|nr:efflux RND transporter permease subunit [Prolixibacteraceae bacterium]